MQDAEDEDEGSVLMYVTEARIPKATQQIAFVRQALIWGESSGPKSQFITN